MNISIEGVTIFSADAKKLADFYKDKLGIPIAFEGIMGENEGGVFEFEMMEGPPFRIMDHDKVKGTNPHPERIMINFEVKNIKKTVDGLVKGGVKCIQDVYHIEDFGFVATFEDPDGNYFQLVQTKPDVE